LLHSTALRLRQAQAPACSRSRLRLAVKRNIADPQSYFFFDAFFAFTLFFAGLLFLVDFLVDFFLPNAEDQLLLYDLLGPLRKMVIVSLRKN
jgi:hypothetical protein